MIEVYLTFWHAINSSAWTIIQKGKVLGQNNLQHNYLGVESLEYATLIWVLRDLEKRYLELHDVTFYVWNKDIADFEKVSYEDLRQL